MKSLGFWMIIAPLWLLPLALEAQQAAKPPPPAKKLFFGHGEVGGLPKVKTGLLPSAEQIEQLARGLTGRQRNLDVFGLMMFPKELSSDDLGSSFNRAAERVTLNQALQTLRITGVSIVHSEFLLGGRNVFEGDVLMLSFKGEVFLAEVTHVGQTEIRFREVKSQETGVLPHTLLPRFSPEPMLQQSGKAALEGKVTPVESVQPIRP